MKKTRFIYLVALLLMAAMGAKAGELAVTSADIGKILCTDGTLCTTLDEAYNANKTAVAMVAFVDEQNRKGLAIALDDVTVNAYAGCSWADRDTHVHDWVTEKDYGVVNATWKVPTVEEWQQMVIGCGAEGYVSIFPERGRISLSSQGINEKLRNIAEACQLRYYYWTATESADDADYAWQAYFYPDNPNDVSLSFSSVSQSESNTVRACLSFDLPDSAPTGGLVVKGEDVGKVVCADGSIYATVGDAVNDGKNPVAMIAYYDATSLTGLAIALADENEAMIWANAVAAAAGHPSVSGGTWKLPSVMEWQQILIGCGAAGTADGSIIGKTISYSELNGMLASAGGTALQSSDYYWSSDKDGDVVLAPFFMQDDYVDFNRGLGADDRTYSRVRACLAFKVSTGDPSGPSVPSGPSYAITVEYDAYNNNGTIACNGTAAEGEVVQVTATPDEGYWLDYLQVKTMNDVNTEELQFVSGGWYRNNTLSFVMPDRDVTLTPFFTADEYLEKVAYVPGNETVSGHIPNGVETFEVRYQGGSSVEGRTGILTLTAPAGKSLRVTGGEINTMQSFEKLAIYEGAGTGGTELYQCVTRYGSILQENITVEDVAGECLTFYFHSENNYDYSNFMFNVIVFDSGEKADIEINDSENGTLFADKEKASLGERVTLYVNPAPGYMLESILVQDDEFNTIEVDGGTWYTYGNNNSASFLAQGTKVTITPTFTAAKTAGQGLFMRMPTWNTVWCTIPDDVTSFRILSDGLLDYQANYHSWNCDGGLVLTTKENQIFQLACHMNTAWTSGFYVYDGTSDSDNVLYQWVRGYGGVDTSHNIIPASGRTQSTTPNMKIRYWSSVTGDATPWFDLTVNVVPTVINASGSQPITTESEVTLPEIEVTYNLSSPGEGDVPDAIINGEDVYVYTLCLPYKPTPKSSLKFYTLKNSDENSLKFVEIEGDPEADTPYLVAVFEATSVGEEVNTSITLQKEIDTASEEADGYKFLGTTVGLTNAEAAAKKAYILQDENMWGLVTTENPDAYIPPFRAYIVPTNASARPILIGGFEDTTGITTMQLTDRDGTTRYFDLNGRRIDSPATRGIYVTNGKKVIINK